jgi:hypothetical protein
LRKGGSKQKGALFERWVCVELSRWMTHSSFGGERRDVFWRSAMSGGRATLGARKGVKLAKQAGDITAIDPVGHELTNKYMIECKHYASLDLEGFVLRDGGKLAAFWRTAQQQARVHDRQPMLIAKQRGAVIMIVPPGTRFYEGSEAVPRLFSRADCDVFDFGRVVLTVWGHKPAIKRRQLKLVSTNK